MAKNIVFEDGNQLTLPVISGTVSGDPVAVGVLPGVALTDRDADGNATVKLNGVCTVDLASGVVTTVGSILYIAPATGVVSSTSAEDSIPFGAALEAKGSGSAKTIEARIGVVAPADPGA